MKKLLTSVAGLTFAGAHALVECVGARPMTALATITPAQLTEFLGSGLWQPPDATAGRAFTYFRDSPRLTPADAARFLAAAVAVVPH